MPEHPLVRRLLVTLLVYCLPAYALSRFLTELNRGAMWIPDEWRRTVGLLSLGAGAAVFDLARASRAKRSARAEAAGSDAVEEAESDRRTQLWVLAAYALSVLCLVPHTVLRSQCIRDWTPSKRQVVSLFSNFQDRHAADVIDDPDLWSQVVIDTELAREPLYLEQPTTKDGPYRGSVLLPLGFPRSPEAERMVAAFKQRDPTRNAVTQWIEEQPTHLADMIRDNEPTAYAWTKLLFLIVHMAVLLSASLAYGLSFSVLGELVGSLPVG